MPIVRREDLGLEVVWLEDEPETIHRAATYLEANNFVVHVCDMQDAESLVSNNGHDLILADLHMPGKDRDGLAFLTALEGRQRALTAIPVSQYLRDYKDRLPEDLLKRAFDKRKLHEQGGLETFRKVLLDQAGGGKLRVLERVIGYVYQELEQQIVIRIKHPDGRRESRVMRKEDLVQRAIGRRTRFFELVTLERVKGNGFSLQSIFRWVSEPQ